MGALGFTREEINYLSGLYKFLKSSIKPNVQFPALVELQTINRCNAKCPMCPYPYTTATKEFKKIDRNLYKKILNELSQEKEFITFVLTFQNEPLMDKDIISMASEFKNLMPGKRLEIVTNGILLTNDIAPRVYELFDTVTISINAQSEQIYKTVTGNLNWKLINKNLDFIASNNHWVNKTVLRFIKQKANYKESKKFKSYWNKRGFIVFGFDINNRLDSVRNFEYIKTPDSVSKNLKMKFLRLLSSLVMKTCPTPFVSFYIRVNGDVVLCFNDWTDKNIMGNVNTSSIKEIFNSKRYNSIRNAVYHKELDNEICQKCDLYKGGIWLTI